MSASKIFLGKGPFDLAGFLAGAVLGVSATGLGHCGDFFCLESKCVDKLLAVAGVPHYYPGILRDQVGSRLFLTLARAGGTLVIVVSMHGMQTNLLPGVAIAVTDDGQPICSISERTLVFPAGQSIPLTAGSRWGFSHDRSVFFFLRQMPSGGSVFRAGDPLTPLVTLPEQFLPQKVFTRTNEIFVFGRKYKGGQAPGTLTGLVWETGAAVPKLNREIDLSRFGGVLDMDGETGLLLVEGKREMFNTWGLFNPKAREYKSLGLKEGHGCFLAAEFRRYLERLCNAKPPPKE